VSIDFYSRPRFGLQSTNPIASLSKYPAKAIKDSRLNWKIYLSRFGLNTLWSEVICDRCPQQPPYYQLPPEFGSIDSVKPIDELLGNRFDKVKVSILIEKSRHRLTIYHNKWYFSRNHPLIFGDRLASSIAHSMMIIILSTEHSIPKSKI
jgi:hypothetical protein